MAQIIPEGSITAISPAPQLHKNLSALPDSVTVYQEIISHNDNEGLRYWLTQGKHSVLLVTLSSTNSLSDSTEITEESLRKLPELFELIQDRNALLPASLQDHAKHLLPIILFLPESLDAKQVIRLKDQGVLAIGDVLVKGALPRVLEKYWGLAHSEQVKQMIRRQFCPEIILSQQANQTTILDEAQERGLKSGLITTTPKQTTKLLLGVAGSGKSTVLVKRASLVHSLIPNAKILVLSHNKAINNVLKEQITLQTRKSNNIHCHPFMEWCRKQLGGTWQFVFDDQETELFDQMVNRHFPDGEVNRHSLIREINFIKAHALQTESDYLDSLSSSSSYALSNPIRKRIWQTCIDVDTHLRDRKRYLWSNAPSMLLEALNDGKIFEPYTHVFVDEAQYFAPAWITLLQRIMTLRGQLFLAADSAHNFSDKVLSWHNTGIELRGNTTNLNHSYRCNAAICKVADGFRVNRSLQTLHNPLCPSNRHKIQSSDTQPKLLQFPSNKEQQRRLFSEIHQLVEAGTNPSDILVLCHSKQASRLLAQDIKQALNLPATALTGSMIHSDDSVKLCDIESATGLQSKVVFITGIEDLMAIENSSQSNAHDRRSLKIEHTQLLHMAMTRAAERLYLLMTCAKIPEEWEIDGLLTPTLSTNHLAPVTYLKAKASTH
ncbi:hypothetical protein EOL70_06100 [Leucothrix sargassi]|nr:hypothetical protein EOL70_06100 [Leucothrix sargassi]